MFFLMNGGCGNNIQNPSTKQQIIFNNQYPGINNFKLEFGYWLLFGYWNLVIGISTKEEKWDLGIP